MKEGKLKRVIQFLNKHLFAISLFLGIFIILGLRLKYLVDGNFLGFINRETDIIYNVIFLVGIIALIYYNLKIKNKRLWITSIVVGCIFAVLYYFGELQNDYIHSYISNK